MGARKGGKKKKKKKASASPALASAKVNMAIAKGTKLKKGKGKKKASSALQHAKVNMEVAKGKKTQEKQKRRRQETVHPRLGAGGDEGRLNRMIIFRVYHNSERDTDR